ncbi:MAG: AIPR family protein [Anaerolineales bacterium]|nr:AIPR family protein [Anaerolineales bacterium]
MSFHAKITNQVTELKKQFGYPNDGTSFGHFILRECFNKIIDFEYDGTDYDSFIKNHIVDMANDLGNDAIFTNQKNREIIVFQFKYSNGSLLNTDEIKKNKKFIDWILNINPEQLTPNVKLKKIIEEEISLILTQENIETNNYSISFYYIDNTFEGTIKTDIKALYNNYNDRGINFQIKFYNYNELEELYDDIEIPKNEVTLKVVPNEYFIKRVSYHDATETPVETIVTSIIANSLKPIIEEKKELILALNVRYYKGENDINSKIKTEYSKGKKSNFWILNNGINAVCEDFEIKNDNLKIKNFQIVNGGQTTKTLTRIINDLPDEVQILMRLTKIKDKAQTSKISMDIAVASNSQNAISARDLHSGDRIQNKIFANLDAAGIFYDKKDGEWATVPKKKYRNPFGNNPMHLKIYNTDLGVAYLSFYLQVPISTVGRHKLVFSEIYYDQIFSMTTNEDDQFYKLILAYRIAERVNRIKTEKLNSYEILQNNYINDVLVALAGIFFFRDNLSKIATVEELIDKLKEVKGQPNINTTEKYILNTDQIFDDFILKEIGIVQNILDVKKEAKKEFANAEWIANDTNNWLKKDGTYREIYEKVIKKLKQ